MCFVATILDSAALDRIITEQEMQKREEHVRYHPREASSPGRQWDSLQDNLIFSTNKLQGRKRDGREFLHEKRFKMHIIQSQCVDCIWILMQTN